MTNHTSIFKRGLSLLVAVVMCLSLLPGTAWAAEEVICYYCGTTCHWKDNGRFQECPNCGATYDKHGEWKPGDKPLPCEHTKTEVRNAVDVTCGQDGYTGDAYCLACEALVEKGTPIPATGNHAWGNWVVTGGSCTEPGSQTRTCEGCGKVETEPGSTTGHTPGTPVRENEEDATCTEAGSYDEVVRCTVCNAEISRETETIPATGEHTPKEVEEEPTCTEPGVTGKTVCTVCGETIHEGTVIAASGHEFGAPSYELRAGKFNIKALWEIKTCTKCGHEEATNLGTNAKEYKVAPTCTQPGKIRYTYGSAGNSQTIEVIDPSQPALGHIKPNENTPWKDGVGFGKSGYHVQLCGRSGCKTVMEFEAHIAGEEVIFKAPTCEEKGYAKTECTVCHSHMSGRVLEPLKHDFGGEWKYKGTSHWQECQQPGCTAKGNEAGHTFTEAVLAAPTCAAEGTMEYKCEICGYTHTASIPVDANNHTPGQPEITPATCQTTGMTVTKCAGCEKVLSVEPINKLPHTVVIDPAVRATCVATGLTEGSHCGECGEVLAAQMETPVAPFDAYTSHDIDLENGTLTTAPGCESAGVMQYPCQREGCAYIHEVAVSAEGHTLAAYADVAPTCTETGLTGGTYCAVCNAVIEERTVVAANGHAYGDAWQSDVGSHWHACTVCGVEEAHAFHAWDAGVVTIPATTAAAGLMTYTCTDCQRTRTETIPALTPSVPNLPGFIDGGGTGAGGTDIGENDIPLGELPEEGENGEDGEETDIADGETPLASGLNLTDRVAYLAGYEDGTVRPSNQITRAEVATVFFRLMTGVNASSVSPFTDVLTGQWFNEAVSTAAAAGILRGYGDGSFRPGNNITRAEFAAIAARFLGMEMGPDASFTDVAGHWAEQEIGLVTAAGWMGGYEDGTFRPDQTITRAEVAIVINRMLGRDIADRAADTRTWSDNPETAWFFQDIQEATNGVLN